MGDIVSVIVKEAEKQPKPKKIDYRKVRQEKRKHVYMHGAWTHDEAKVTRRVKRWEAKKGTLSHQYIEFALSRAMFEGRNWECINILGEGSFGIVGLWQQFDNTGKLLDSVAIKEILDMKYEDGKHGEQIPMEPYAMQEMRKAWSVTKLRDCLEMVPTQGKSSFRLYQEFCANGTILDLVQVYKKYNKAHPEDHRNIPEEFIWYAFYGLAVTLVEMNQAECKLLKQPPGRPYMLHFDIKDQNILLGKPFQHKYLSNYPVIKVADWGIAGLTSDKDPKNSRAFVGCGTQNWDPPESAQLQTWGAEWRRPPHGPKNRPLTIAHSQWQFAAVIMTLMVLDEYNVKVRNQVKLMETQEELVYRRNMNLFAANMHPDFRSRELWDLTVECLNIDPKKRPKPHVLLARTEEGLKKVARECERKNYVPKLFYGDSGLEDMEAYYKPRMRRR